MSEENYAMVVLAQENLSHAANATLIDSDCGHTCWISPATRAIVEDESVPTQTICMGCLMEKDEEQKKFLESVRKDGLHTPPGGREELNEELGVAETDQLFATFRVTEKDPHELLKGGDDGATP